MLNSKCIDEERQEYYKKKNVQQMRLINMNHFTIVVLLNHYEYIFEQSEQKIYPGMKGLYAYTSTY